MFSLNVLSEADFLYFIDTQKAFKANVDNVGTF